jgi:hypothetical protein
LYTNFWSQNLKERDWLEDQDIKDLEERGWVGIDQGHLCQNRDKWWAVVKTVMNFDEMQGIS